MPNQQCQSTEGIITRQQNGKTHTTTTTALWPFVWDYPGEMVPEGTLTHPPTILIIQSLSASSIYHDP